MTWDAIVLAGGRGSRLGGVDKATLEIAGETLLARTLRAVAGADRVIVVGDARAPGAIVVQEEPRFAGPAAAIGAGLGKVRAPYVLVVACDQPFLGDVVETLVGAAADDGVVAIDQDGRRQYLMSVLDTAALRAAIAAQPTLTDLSVRALLAPLTLVEIAVPAGAALDIDTWHDRDKALEQGGHDG
ncbi:molybdopterin-guanine dinucleotide biosynthesis protein MobA [Aeromicrobium sp. A1-2]|uniref:molybdenum cofactor guanylyltransferase n=1 Tax=Aeromicrobium sp. A1-2 TaxID=2107713 RepID=UPI000E4ECBFA|nr:NTP transferase domain-containing protein [Aeromicrobium sp. A1-2]AXT85818.1 molybdopterin-guanine dinucleotide biosynthesis protein MobA [Aeromicrobium sp. A1-2]